MDTIVSVFTKLPAWIAGNAGHLLAVGAVAMVLGVIAIGVSRADRRRNSGGGSGGN